MLDKVITEYSAPISKFKINPSAFVKEAQGDAVAVMSHNTVDFYAVPAELYREMIEYLEYAQRGTSELISVPGKFNMGAKELDEATQKMANMIKNEKSSFEEC